MPRNYIKKKPPVGYTVTDLQNAVSDVLEKKMTYRQVEEKYKIPKSVVFQRINGRKSSLYSIRSGRQPSLPALTENEIVKCLVTRANMGLPCDKRELKELVGEYVKCSGIKTQFKDDIPGEDWYMGFMKRHPTITLKKPEQLQKLRKDARNPFVVYDFYDKLQKVMEDNELTNKPQYVFNADESGFHHDPSSMHALGVKGKALSRISGGSGRESTTVLACVSADGAKLPPLIIFKGAAVQARWTSDAGFPGTLYAASKNGWMEEPQFFNWLSDGFIPFVRNIRGGEGLQGQAALLLYDGHCSHISVRIVEKALQNNVILMRLPSHLTDKLQPLDKCVFGPVKTAWEKKLIDFGKMQMGKGCMRLNKQMFSKLIGETWQDAMIADNIISGFVNTGIYPVDRTKFPENEFPPEALERYRSNSNGVCLELTSDRVIAMELAEGTEVANIIVDNETSTGVERMQENDMNMCNLIETVSEQQSNMENAEVLPGTSISSLFIPPDSPLQANQPPVKEKKPIPRLKQMTYGEVLTSESVLKRLKEAEDLKKAKQTPKPKKTISGKNQRSIKKRHISSSSEESENEKNIEYDEDSPWNEELDDDDEHEQLEPVGSKTLNKGQFLLIQLKGGTRLSVTFRNVCVIESAVESNEIEVVLLKSMDNTKTTFALMPTEKRTVLMEDILGILPNPTLNMSGARIYYKFKKTLNVKEK